ncbi:DEKNAAC100387 [Brettanomyces naardenensis]|uniref:DEKNAAC100387 n=1 Tax=Brettanomyces naardenensis TaxID=13370 RepID=A0A448YFG9_BRENA|nr:DEKNAAC100387 [Brettanomyces naardenensis]
MLVIGLTGGIASGKSTVSKRLHDEYGLTVIDADQIAREIVEPGKPAYNHIVEYFSTRIPDLINRENGSLNRTALGRYVFVHKEELQVLNSLTHPEVRKEIIRRVLSSWIHFEKLCVLDVPLLFESRMDELCGSTLCIVCDREIQLQRLLKRNPEWTRQDCENRIDNQMSNDERKERADVVLDNDTTLDVLYDRLDKSIRRMQPSTAWTYLEVLCPPITFLSAAFCFLRNLLRRSQFESSYKRANLKKVE